MATPVTGESSVALPLRAGSPLRAGICNAFVFSADSSLDCPFGWAEDLDISSDGDRFDVSWLWLAPPLVSGPFHFLRVINPTTQDMSIAMDDGYPRLGPLDPPLLDVPHWVSPNNPAMTHPLHNPLEWELFDAEIPIVSLWLYRGDALVWRIGAGANANALTVPEPPSSVDAPSYLGSSPLEGYLFTGRLNADKTRWERVAQARPVLLTP